MKVGLLGRKVGMTRIYEDGGRATAVTVIHVAGNRVLQVKTAAADGYDAIQIGYGEQKPQRVTRPLLGHFRKTGSPPKRFVREFRLARGERFEGAPDLDATLFDVGQFVDVIAWSKGKGFQGVMRKHNAGGQPASHGSMMHRRTGAIAPGSTPGLVYRNSSMPGHLGHERVTIQNLRIAAVRPEDGLLLVAGAVPGPKTGFVVVRPAKKKAPDARARTKQDAVPDGKPAAGAARKK